MRREQLEHAIRAAGTILAEEAVIIIGSQAILGSYVEEQRPPEAVVSIDAATKQRVRSWIDRVAPPG